MKILVILGALVAVASAQSSLPCQFPFIHSGVTYTACTTVDDPEGKLWCSTRTDIQDNHVTGGGHYKHCTDADVPQTGSATSGNDIEHVFLNSVSTDDLLSNNRNFRPTPQGGQCSTPERIPGTCGSLIQCGAYRSQARDLRRNLSFFKARLCRLEPGRAFVCCPQPGAQAPSQPFPVQPSLPSQPSISSSGRNSLFIKDCGISTADRVVGGTEISVGAYPWLVGIGVNGFSGYQLVCGGSLVTARHVVTAAHCWDGVNPDLVRVGEHDLKNDNDGAQTLRIVRKSIHPSYNKDKSENDVAVATLERNVNFDRNILPICLPFRGDLKNYNFENRHLDVVGWGKLNERATGTTNIPQEAKVKVGSLRSCIHAYRNVGNINLSNKQLCAAENGKDSCQGDSGGPLNYLDNGDGKYYLAGVVSTGRGCARADFPGVYVRVGAYLDWIVSKIQ
ncbi:unnamed protein product [Meganyctiphanes norvegica]|uniref:CLIP domain-containing serine protease n=1 Tax=Meganyctiphanes norvegica TaxID=48144 RepID=A0AAV2QFQ5_MEGNR